MRSRRTWVEVLGPIFGLLAAALTVYALVHLLWIEPFYSRRSYSSPGSRARGLYFAPGWKSREITEAVEGRFSNLEIKNVSGPIAIESWSEEFVQVHYVKKARTQELLEEFEIEILPRGDSLSVRPLYRTIPGSPFGSVFFDIKLPPSVRKVSASNVSGRIELANVGANIDQRLETVSGRIITELSGDLRAKTVSGSIDFAFDGSSLEAASTSGSIRGHILSLDPGGSVAIETISGSVDLQAFPALDASLKLHSVSGSISCDFPVRISEQRRNRLEGTVGGGAVPFNVTTVSGRIRLHE
jgi:hypothetical protein